jgi:hypothetical protein
VGEGDPTVEGAPELSGGPRGESRAPVVVVLLLVIGLFFLMPEQLLPGPIWLMPAILAGFLVALVVTDPGRIDRRSVGVRRIRIGLVVVLVGSTAWATINLTTDLVNGGTEISTSASALLRAGGIVWLGLVISFSFLYWELDLGGPGERAHKKRVYPDLAFPQDSNPEIRPTGWRPVFVDYLYLGLTNAIAFSPTDVMPLAHWAKLAMGVESVTSLLILGLVIARAVNVLQ